jgi:hypothetical protein
MAEQVKLTEAEVRGNYVGPAVDHIVELLRERGLIAEEPVDPLLVEAREICARIGSDLCGKRFPGGGAERCEMIRAGGCDDFYEARIALAALHRGIEIGEANRKELTREGVRAAVAMAHLTHCLRDDADADVLGLRIKRLHAALQEQLK